MADFSQLPPPPKNQTGVNPDQFSHLPPPPKGAQGFTLDQIKGSQPQDNSAYSGTLGTKPGDSFYGKVIDNSVTRGIQNIFPGKQIGEGVGNSLQGAYQAVKTHSMAPINEAADENNKNAPKIFGDAVNAGLTAAAPFMGGTGSALAKIGTNVALGAGLGASNKIAQGGGATEALGGATTGGILGGGLSAAGETAKYLTENMPNWFTKLALPKLGSSLKGTPQETIDYALANTKGSSLKSMYGNSQNAIKSYENQIQAVLSHPQYANEGGNIAEGLKNVQQSFPNAQLDENKIVSILKQVAPENKAIVDKVLNGEANLQEQNVLRKELDQATKKAYGDKPTLTFSKSVGKSMADFLRGNVKATAKETVPIFSDYSKEHTLNKALGSALSRKRVAGPLAAGLTGLVAGGPKSALEAIAVEEGVRSPTARLLAAKGIQSIGKTAPVAGAIFRGARAPLINAATNSRETKK